MSAFGLPVETSEIPPFLVNVIEQSVQEFEERFGSLAMMARANGWIEDYRQELRRIAALAYQVGRDQKGTD